MGGGWPSVRCSRATWADEALSVTLFSATSNGLMAHLRLFQPHRRTQSLRFPDFAIGDLRRIRIIAARARRGRFTATLRTPPAADGAVSPCPIGDMAQGYAKTGKRPLGRGFATLNLL